MAEKIIIEAVFDAKEAKAQQVEFTKQLLTLKEALDEVTKQFKNGEISQSSFAKKSVELTAKIRQVQDAQKGLSRDMEVARKFNDAQAGSIAANRVELEQLLQVYKQLGNPTKEQTEQVNTLTNRLKKQEAAISESKKSMGDYIRDINFMGISVGDTADQLKNSADGFQTFTKGVSLSKGALVALAAVPIVLFLVGLVAFFKQTDAGADKLEQGINALKTSFTVFTKGLVVLKDSGEAIFKSLIDGAKGLWDILAGIHTLDFERVKTGIAETGQAFTDAKTSISNTASSLSNLTGQAYRAALAEVELTKATQDLEDAQDALVEKRAIADAAVSKALLTAKDRNKTEKERIALLAQAGKLEAEVVKEEVKLKEEAYRLELRKTLNLLAGRKESDEELKKMTTEQLRATLDRYHQEGIARDEDVKKVRAAYVEKVRVASEAANTLQGIDNRTAALEQQFAAAREARAKKAAQEELKRLKQQQENDKAVREGREAEDRYEAELLQKKLDRLVKHLQRELDIKKDMMSKDNANIAQSFDDSELVLANQVLAKEITESEATEKRLANQKDGLERQIAVTKFYGESTTLLETDLANKEIEIAQNAADKKEKLEAAKYQAARAGVEAIGSLLEIASAGAEENAEFQKSLTLLQIGISSAEAISLAVVHGQKYGFPASIGVTAAAVASVLANFAKVKQMFAAAGSVPKAPAKKFAQGVIDLDGPGTSRSDSIPAWLSRGESVLNAPATAAFKPVLAAMNDYGNGKPFRFSEMAEAGRLAGGGDRGLTADGVASIVRETVSSMPAQILRVRDLDYVYGQRESTARVSDI